MRCSHCGHEVEPEPEGGIEFGVVRPFPTIVMPRNPEELIRAPREYSTITQQPEPQTITT